MELTELKELVNEYYLKKQEIKQINGELDKIKEQAESLEYQIKNILEAAELDRFDTELCSVSMKAETSVLMPQDDDKESFYDYLKQEGLFEAMVSVNSKTLNAWYRREEALAMDRGEVLEIPGLNNINTYTKISMRTK